MSAADLYVKRYDRKDIRLGRQVVFDERSRNYALNATVDTSTWRTRTVRVYDPLPNPNQCHGECTGCSKSTEFNAVGNRVKGQVLNMDDAHRLYTWASNNDPWPGAFPEQDTGSSTLAAAKAAQAHGLGGTYRYLFGGADEVVQTVVNGRVVVVGTRWDYRMFDQDADGRVEPGGGVAGGHAYVFRGFDADRDWVMGRCWWGGFRDFWIRRDHLAELLADDGDAHVQDRA